MPQPVDLYGTAYGNFAAPALGQVRRETYGEDFGQSSWVTGPEYRRLFRLLDLRATDHVYAGLAEGCGFRVLRLHTEERWWDFKTREAFLAYCQVTLAEWTRLLPEAERPAFILDALDRYRSVAADRPCEENTFKFYQMDVLLAPRPGEGGARNG